MSGDVFLTQEGFEKLNNELDHLKTVKRREIGKSLERARAMGDLSENAEYDAAKDAQAHLEKRIAGLEDKLSRARIIDHEDIPKDKAYIGARVKLRDEDTQEELEYRLVSAPEADYAAGKISLESPIGKALLGRRVDEVFEVKVPAGVLKYRILSIER